MNSFCPLAIDEDEDCQKNLKYEKSANHQNANINFIKISE